MTRRLALGTLLATSVALLATACGPQPAATGTTGGATNASTTTGTRTAATNSSPTGILGDDPSGLLGGKVAPIGAAPGALTASVQTAGEQTSQDVATALGTEQEMDVYAMSFDKGNLGLALGGSNIVATGGGNIVATGGGNIVATGGGNYALLELTPTTGATGATGATSTSAASAAATPLPLPGGLTAHFHPTFGALTTPSVRVKVVARHKVQLARLAARAQSMPELATLRGAINQSNWIANPDGTLTKTVETDVSKTIQGGAFSRHVLVRATVHAGTDIMLHQLVHFELDFKDGSKRITTREVVMLDDGTHHIEFHQDVIGKLGFHHTVEWTKDVDLDALVTGHGSLSVINPKGKVTASSSVEFDGTADAPRAHVVDVNTKLDAKVSLSASGQLKAVLRDQVGATGDAKVTADAAPTSSAEEDALATSSTVDATATHANTPASSAPATVTTGATSAVTVIPTTVSTSSATGAATGISTGTIATSTATSAATVGTGTTDVTATTATSVRL
jgi:hypothetical protein